MSRSHVKTILLLTLCLILEGVCGQNNKFSLGSPVNRDETVEHAPAVSFDGQTLLYEAVATDGAKQWMEARLLPSGRWSPPVLVRLPVPPTAANSISGVSLSIDNSTLYFAAVLPGGLGEADIYYTQRTGNAWGPPVNLGPEINSEGTENFPSMSPGGRELYFARRRPDRVGQPPECYAILVARKGVGDKWRRAIDLPPAINTGCETTPRLLPDGRTLVFSSNRAGGKGGYDLYKAVQSPDGTWQPPAPLAVANTKHDEYAGSVSALADRVYFQSKDEISGTELPAEERPTPMQLLKGSVLDEVTRQPVDTRLLLTNLAGKEPQTELATLKGGYSAALRPNEEYLIEIKLPQYLDIRRRIRTTGGTYREMTEDFRLRPRNVPVHYVFKDSATRLPIQLDFKLVSQKSGRPLNIVFDSVKTRYITRITMQESYTAEGESVYHEAYAATLRLDSVRSYDPVEIEVLLKKIYYGFTLVAVDARSKQMIPEANIVVREKDTGLLYLPEVNAAGENVVELRKDKEYTIEATLDHYKPLQETFRPGEMLKNKKSHHQVTLEREE